MSRPPMVLAAVGLLAVNVGCKRAQATPATEGRDLFANTCARCHGADGAGGLPLFEGGPSPRNFHEPAFQRSHSDMQIRMMIVNGKGSGMPPFGTTFTDAQLDALVAHVRSFDPEKNK